MSRPILVPVDGSVFAEQALPHALAVASLTDAPLHPVMVHFRPPVQDYGRLLLSTDEEEMEAELRERERSYLDRLGERLRSADVAVQPPVLLHGDPARALVDHIAEREIGFVVAATHARTGFERFWLHSVAETLLHRLTIPMLFVRPDPDAIEADPVHAATPYRTILVPLDGSRDAEASLDDVLRLASDARVVLLRVVLPPPMLSSSYIPHAAQIQKDESRRRAAEAGEYLDALAARVTEAGPDVETRIVVRGHTVDAILRTADEVGADLIAMGSHGHGLLRRALFGSVTDTVLRATDVPVLVHREE